MLKEVSRLLGKVWALWKCPWALTYPWHMSTHPPAPGQGQAYGSEISPWPHYPRVTGSAAPTAPGLPREALTHDCSRGLKCWRQRIPLRHLIESSWRQRLWDFCFLWMKLCEWVEPKSFNIVVSPPAVAEQDLLTLLVEWWDPHPAGKSTRVSEHFTPYGH